MELTIFDKLGYIFKYITSSFLGIEIFILSVLLFLFTVLKKKKNNKIVKIASSMLCLGFLIGIAISYHSYALYCIDSLIKVFLSYLYFPSMVTYFFMMMITTGALIVTILSNKMSKSKRIINSIALSILYLCFMCVAALAISNHLDLSVAKELYQNDTLLAFIQISNLIFSFWVEYTCLYYLYKFLEYKLDKKSS